MPMNGREAHEAAGSLVAEAKVPTVGEVKSEGLEGDGYVVIRDESTAVVQRAEAPHRDGEGPPRGLSGVPVAFSRARATTGAP